MTTLLVILNIIFWFSVSVTVVTYVINSLTEWTDSEAIGIMKVFSTIALVMAATILIYKYSV